MNPVRSHQISNIPPPICLGFGCDAKYYRDTAGLILLFQLILLNYFYFSKKVIIFVRLFDYRKVFALFYLWSDKRKPTTGLFRLHRLIYFTRGVGCPTPTEAIKSEWDDKISIKHAAAGNPAI